MEKVYAVIKEDNWWSFEHHDWFPRPLSAEGLTSNYEEGLAVAEVQRRSSLVTFEIRAIDSYVPCFS